MQRVNAGLNCVGINILCKISPVPLKRLTHYQKPLPGKLVCVLLKLAVIKEFRIEF